MPELPEVETTRRFLEPALVGKRIMSAEVRRVRMVRRQEHPGDFVARVTGRTIRRFGRHGKFLVADLSGDLTWVTHLGMSGRMSLATRGDPEPPHTNVVIRVGGGVELRFVDPRTFGFVVALTPHEMAESSMTELGPDALNDPLSTSKWQQVLVGRTAAIKALLLDQHIVAGLGNIYADEALYRARIAPQRAGGDLDRRELGRLRTAVKATLEDGLTWGGTSLDDLAYLLPDGRAGEFAGKLRAYGRTGEPCRRCGTPIRHATLRQRSTHWCPQCQV